VIWVKKDNKNLGRVEISKGGLSWYRPKGGNPLHDLTWTELLNLLNNR